MKLKDILKESWIGGFVSENAFSTEKQIDTNAFLESIRRYSEYGQSVYRKGNLRDVATTLSELAEQASVHTIQELEDDFDKITVGRNMKELKGYSQQFSKFANEAQVLQQRIESLYEDMGSILNRYYEINSNKK